MAEPATEIAKKIEENRETKVTLAPTETVVEGTSKPAPKEVAATVFEAGNKQAEEEVKEKETSSLVETLESKVEIKASAEKFHHMFTAKPHHVSKASPGNIQSCDLHDGEWGQVGSIVFWNYVHDGVAKVAKERIEAVEPEKNLITFRVLEGDLMKEYKSFVVTIQVTPKHGGPGSIVHWHLEYEKISDEVAHPETLLQFCVEMSKEVDEYLLAEESGVAPRVAL